MSTANGIPNYCGMRQYVFTRTDTGIGVSDLLTEAPSGDWYISATSSAYTAGSTLEIKATVTLEYVDPVAVFSEMTFDLSFYSY